jgi:hypothetical protein
MTTKVKDPAVIGEVNSLKDVCRFGVKIRNVFKELQISIDQKGKLFYTNDNHESKSVSSLIKNMTGWKTARWVDHLYFIDAFGREREFKTFVNQRLNLNIS